MSQLRFTSRPSAGDLPEPPEAIWQAVLGELQLQTTRATFDAWLKGTTLVAYEDGTFIIGVSSGYARDFLDSRLRGMIKTTLSEIAGRAVDLRIVVRPKSVQDRGSAGPLLEAASLSSAPSEFAATEAQTNGHLPLDSNLTFQTFIVGASNRMAHAAALAVVDRPGLRYNPLFLWGGVGLGKTHLLHAIGHAARDRGYRVVYVSSEAFTNDLIKAIRAQATEAFREKYRTADFLLIDDIQFIAGKESTQEEFFHTFNTLHGARKQIVICSDRPPQAFTTLEERLRSRFEGGLCADLQPPDFEMRLAILRAKAEAMGVRIPDAVTYFIAERVHRNVRELTGALNRVVAQAEVLGIAPNLDVAQMVLQDLSPRANAISPEMVLDVVAEEYGLSPEDLSRRGRSKEVVLPRQVAMYLLREVTQLSLPQIGELVGGRDHTTVMHGINKIASLSETDTALRRQLLALKERLYAPSSASRKPVPRGL